jgi:hypothetical protein
MIYDDWVSYEKPPVPKRLRFYYPGVRELVPTNISGGRYLEVMVVRDRPGDPRPWWMLNAAERMLLSLN